MSVLPMSVDEQAAVLGYHLKKFVDRAPLGFLGRWERKRRIRIVLLELQLMRYEVGTELWEATRKKILDNA